MSDQRDTGGKPEEPQLKVVDRRWWVRDQANADADSDAGSEDRGLRKPTYVEELERQLAEKNELLQEYISKYKDAAREFDAAKARIRRDVVKDVERGKRAVMAELLDVVDNFDRAIEAARQAGETGALLQGVEMVRAQFLSRLEGFGVTRMPALGQAFDPSRHEAVSTVPVGDPAQENHVLGVIREGYEMGGEVLRPALVAVGQKEG
jgi:molecular chaperone GrpE